MKYYILSPEGRTGSRRIQRLLDLQLNKNFNNCLIKLHSKIPLDDSVVDHYVGSKMETKTLLEVQEWLGSCKDNTVVHSHIILAVKATNSHLLF